MEFKVLGELEVTHNGEVIAVARRKCQGLLALLISRYPHGMSLEALADALWPDTDPKKSANSVRVHMTYLRKSLVTGPDVVTHTIGRYTLAIDRAQLDVCRFEDLSTEARLVAAAGDPHKACALYERAIAEWEGVPYAELRDIDALRGECARLDSLYLDGVEGYATALLDDDRADQACRILEPLIDAHLIRETLAARLMLGLYRTGRQQDALAVFGRVKAALAEGLGLLPNAALQGLADAIVLQTPALDLARGATRTANGGVSSGANTRPLASAHTDTRVVHPTMTSRQPVTFVGRDAELGRMNAAWRRAESGTPQLVYVVGVAGVGKTTLTKQFVAGLRTTAVTVVTGQCEAEPSENFQPFPHLVRTVLAHDPPTDTSPSTLGELRRLTPELAERLPIVPEPPEPGAGRQRMFTAVANILATPSQPRVLILEDLHWASADALLLLRHVLRAASGQIMVLATLRLDEITIDPSVREVLAGGRLGQPDDRIELGTMNRHEVAALIDAVAPASDRALWMQHLDELTDVSAGNPLRLREVLRQIELEPDTPISAIAPDDVRAIVTRRLDHLDEETRRIVQTAAVFGREFSLPRVGAATGLSEDSTLDALERAAAVGLVSEGERADEFAFTHPLFRNAVYSSLSKSRGARRHLACANVLAAELERTDSDVNFGEVAHHLLAARPVSDAAHAAKYARLAGGDAAARYAHEEAVEWYHHAVECAVAAKQPARKVADLRLALGAALEDSGEVTAARTEYFLVADIARDLSDAALLRGAAIAATPRESVLDATFAPRLAALVDEALDTLGADDPARVQLLRSAVCARIYFDPDSVPAIADETHRLAQRSTDPLIRHWALAVRYLSTMADATTTRLSVSRDIRHHTERYELATELGGASRRFLVELLIQGATEEFDAELASMVHTARATSIPADLYWANAFRATRALMCDCSTTTEELINAAALVGIRMQVWVASGMQLLQTFALRYQQGRAREVTQGLSVPNPSEPQVLAGTALLAVSLADAGRLEPARALLNRVVSGTAITLPFDNFRTAAVALFGGVAAACGTPQQQDALREALSPHANEFCVFGAGGAVFGTNHHWLARLATAAGEPEAAHDHLQTAARLCDHADAAFWADRARHELADLEQR